MAILPMGPSGEYLARSAFQQEIYDDLPPAHAALVNEYGFDRTMAALRSARNVEQARATLEAQRRYHERLRWANNGRLPVSY
jgi:hypothetical protein